LPEWRRTKENSRPVWCIETVLSNFPAILAEGLYASTIRHGKRGPPQDRRARGHGLDCAERLGPRLVAVRPWRRTTRRSGWQSLRPRGSAGTATARAAEEAEAVLAGCGRPSSTRCVRRKEAGGRSRQPRCHAPGFLWSLLFSRGIDIVNKPFEKVPQCQAFLNLLSKKWTKGEHKTWGTPFRQSVMQPFLERRLMDHFHWTVLRAESFAQRPYSLESGSTLRQSGTCAEPSRGCWCRSAGSFVIHLV
jgi:hypothetical protein